MTIWYFTKLTIPYANIGATCIRAIR